MVTTGGWGQFSAEDSSCLVAATSTPVLICDAERRVVSVNAAGAAVLEMLTPDAERLLPPTGWEVVTLTGEPFDPIHGVVSRDDPDRGLVQIRSCHDSRGAWYSFQRIVLEPDAAGARYAFIIRASAAYEAAARMWRHERFGNDAFATVTVAPDGAIAIQRHSLDSTSQEYDDADIRIITGESALRALTAHEAPLSEWIVVELTDADGSQWVVEADGWGRRLPDGTLLLDLVVRDISREAEVRKQLDDALERFTMVTEELAAARAYQKAVLDQGSDAVLVFDRDGAIRFGADRYRQLMGLGPDVLPGNGWIGKADPAAKRIVEEAGHAILAAPHGTTTTCQFRTRKPDGEEIELDCVLTNRLADPILRGVVVSVRDVTARNESERRFGEMARLVGEGLMAMHLHTSVVAFANDAMAVMTGLDADQLVGTSWRSFVHPDDIERMKTEWLATPAGEISRVAVRIRRPDGSVVPVTITSASPYDRNPNDRWTFAVVTDVSELRRTQDELDAAVRQAQGASAAKSRVVYDVSHELRTPLAPIVAFSELLVEEANDPTVREYANYILRSSERLTRLADDLVDISRIESGVVPVELAPVSALAVCREAATTLVGHADRAGRSITVDGDDVMVCADAVRLVQVVSNLVHNALVHALTDVSVEVRRAGDRALISVSDRGPGIPLEHRERVFEPFVRLHASETPGTGLGLPIVRALVDAMDGTATIAQRDGGGTTIECSLPVWTGP